MFGALTPSQMLILRHAQAGTPQPMAGRRPVFYREDIEVLMIMGLLILTLGVAGITEFGAAYLRLTDAKRAAADAPPDPAPSPTNPTPS
jgi:hypothetical protein